MKVVICNVDGFFLANVTKKGEGVWVPEYPDAVVFDSVAGAFAAVKLMLPTTRYRRAIAHLLGMEVVTNYGFKNEKRKRVI